MKEENKKVGNPFINSSIITKVCKAISSEKGDTGLAWSKVSVVHCSKNIISQYTIKVSLLLSNTSFKVPPA